VGFAHPPRAGGEDGTSRSEGVADLAARRVRVRLHAPLLDRMVERFVDAVQPAFPWLAEEEDDGEPAELVFVGGSSAAWLGDRWTELVGDESDDRRPGDPTWILEQLARGDLDDVRSLGVEPVGGIGCRRVVAVVTTNAPPATVHHRVYAETWIGPDGLVRRVTRTDMRDWRGRPRSPLRRGDDGRRFWRTLELSDFGIPVDIPTPPAPARSETDESLPRVVWDLYRTRRRWLREHR
jgi:hypothetical protein